MLFERCRTATTPPHNNPNSATNQRSRLPSPSVVVAVVDGTSRSNADATVVETTSELSTRLGSASFAATVIVLLMVPAAVSVAMMVMVSLLVAAIEPMAQVMTLFDALQLPLLL